MVQRILLSGERANFTVLELDEAGGKLDFVADYKAPFNASWIEPSSSQGNTDYLVGLSEGVLSGLLYTFKIDHSSKTCNITSQKPTLGAPGHFLTTYDKLALALGTYLGGSVALYPISLTKDSGLLLKDSPRTEIFPDFPYEQVGHGPVEFRQRQCHVHQVLEDKRSLLYAPDLGADRTWILRRDALKLELCGWLQCPPGSGPRHAVLAKDDTFMYVVGEMSHSVVAFELLDPPSEGITSIDSFQANIIPPSVHTEHQSMMDSAEICLHPIIPNLLYVSNRWERHIKEREPHLQNVPETLPSGDDVAILLLSSDGRKVESIKHVRTKVDTIRGMRIRSDGRFVIVCGQEGGGVEVYGIGGERGEVWTLVSSLSEGLESQIKHAVWL